MILNQRLLKIMDKVKISQNGNMQLKQNERHFPKDKFLDL